MEDLIESIRSAVAANATDEARRSGAHACRTILLALEGTEGQPLAQPVNANASPLSPQVTAMIGALRRVPPDQLLELAIAKLRAALPAGAEAPQVHPIRFNLVPVRR